MMAPSPSSPNALATHLEFVATYSPYYRALWKDALGKKTTPPLSELPLTDLTSYWEANTPLDSQVLTAAHLDGPVFKSGGTTGNPKFSFFSNEDWLALCSAFGAGMRRGGLSPGERIANLFYGGQLYASFLFIGRALEQAGVGVQYPLSGSAPVGEIIKTLRQFRIDTLAGVPTSLLALLPELASAAAGEIVLKRFLYGGEAMFADQIAALHRVLPDCTVQSVGIAGVDYGELGWCGPGDEPGIHRCFDDSTVLEILDEMQHPIERTGVSGELVISNFRRRLMPVIRYPVGDRGMWLDPPGTPARRFRVLGRNNSSARIGPVSLYIDDIHNVLSKVAIRENIIRFQLQIEHLERRDRCTLRIAVDDPRQIPTGMDDTIRAILAEERPMFAELAEQGIIHPLSVEWLTLPELTINPRTGKHQQVLDLRITE